MNNDVFEKLDYCVLERINDWFHIILYLTDIHSIFSSKYNSCICE